MGTGRRAAAGITRRSGIPIIVRRVLRTGIRGIVPRVPRTGTRIIARRDRRIGSRDSVRRVPRTGITAARRIRRARRTGIRDVRHIPHVRLTGIMVARRTRRVRRPGIPVSVPRREAVFRRPGGAAPVDRASSACCFAENTLFPPASGRAALAAASCSAFFKDRTLRRRVTDKNSSTAGLLADAGRLFAICLRSAAQQRGQAWEGL